MAAQGGKLKRRLKAWNFRRLLRVERGYPYSIRGFSSGIPLRLQVRRCPTFREQVPDIYALAANVERAKRRQSIVRELMAYLVGLCFALIFAAVNLARAALEQFPDYGLEVSTVIAMVTLICFGYVGRVVSWWLRHGTRKSLLFRLLRLSVILERNPQHLDWPLFKTSMNTELERIAKLVERYPSDIGTTDPLSSGIVGLTAARVAAKFREYKVWVAQPGPTTYIDLVGALSTSFLAIADDRWHELPQADPSLDRRMTSLARLLWSGAFAALVGILVLIAIFQTNLGAVGSIGASLVAVLIVFVLGKLGVTLSTLQQQAEVAAKLDIKPKA